MKVDLSLNRKTSFESETDVDRLRRLASLKKELKNDQKIDGWQSDEKSLVESLLVLQEYIDPNVYETLISIKNQQTREDLTVKIIGYFYSYLITSEVSLTSSIYSIIELIINKIGAEDIQILRTLKGNLFKFKHEVPDNLLRINLFNLCNKRLADLKSKTSQTSLELESPKRNTQTIQEVTASNSSQFPDYNNRGTNFEIPVYQELADEVENANREF